VSEVPPVRREIIVEAEPHTAFTVFTDGIGRWEPPTAVAFIWHPGRAAQQASHVEVTFKPAETGRTLVTLVHSGWEGYEDPAAARADYDQGWPIVLDRYGTAVDGALDGEP
jgi:uncharacterized protein YndB with AHSA1/START domain